MVLGCEYHNFIELGQIGKEIINARAFGCPPSLLSLRRDIISDAPNLNEPTYIPS
jgi:hypothetical protein